MDACNRAVRARPRAFELRHDDARVVDDESIARFEQSGKIGHMLMRHAGVRADHKHARHVAGCRRVQRDQRFGQLEIEEVGAHVEQA